MIKLSRESEALARRVTVDAAVRQALASAHAVGVPPEPGVPRDQSVDAVAIRRQ